MTSLERYADGDRQTLRTLVQLDNAPSLIPDLFKDKDKATGEVTVRWGEVVVAVEACRDAGLSPAQDLKHFPVIRGAVFPDAEVWRVTARRHGWSVTTPVDTDDKVVVAMLNKLTGEQPPDFELTMLEARKLGNAANNSLYETIPRSMLRARATMTAIRLNAPDVLRDPAVARWGDWQDPGPAAAAEPAAGPEPPTADRPAVGGTTQHKLRAAIDRLTPGQRSTVADLWRREQLPGVDDLDLDQFMAALDIILDVRAGDQPPPRSTTTSPTTPTATRTPATTATPLPKTIRARPFA